MVKYLLGLLSGIVLVFLLGFVIILVAVFASRPSRPGISADSVLRIDLSGGLTEHKTMDFSFELPGEKPAKTVLNLRRAIAHAAEDDRIRALWLDCGGLGAGWGKAQEIRWAIEEFAKSEKPVYAYMQVGGMLDYYVASAADQIYIAPEGYLDLIHVGLRALVLVELRQRLPAHDPLVRARRFVQPAGRVPHQHRAQRFHDGDARTVEALAFDRTVVGRPWIRAFGMR